MIDIDELAERAVASPISQPPDMATLTGIARRHRRRRRFLTSTVTIACVGAIGIGALAVASPRAGTSRVEVRPPTSILDQLDQILNGPAPKPIPIRLGISFRRLGGWARDAAGNYVDEPKLQAPRRFEWRKDVLGNWEFNEVASASKIEGLIRDTSVDGVARRWRDSKLESTVDRKRKYGADAGPGSPVPELAPYGAALVVSMIAKDDAHPDVAATTCFNRPCTRVRSTEAISAAEGEYLPLDLASKNTLTEEVTYDDATLQVLLHRVILNGNVIDEFEVTHFERLPEDFRFIPGELKTAGNFVATLPDCIEVVDKAGLVRGCVAKADVYGPDGPAWDKYAAQPGIPVRAPDGEVTGFMVPRFGFVDRATASNPRELAHLTDCIRDLTADRAITDTCRAVLAKQGATIPPDDR